MEKDKEHRTIHTEILTFDGDEDRFKFKLDALVGTVKAEALARFDIIPSSGVKYKLGEKKDGNFRILDDNNSLGTEGIQNKDTLWLGTEQQVG